MVQLLPVIDAAKKLDYQSTIWRSYSGCGYPIDAAEIYNFLKPNRNRIQKVECAEFFSDEVKEITIAEAFHRFDEYNDLFSRQRFTDEDIINSIVNTHLRFTIARKENL